MYSLIRVAGVVSVMLCAVQPAALHAQDGHLTSVVAVDLSLSEAYARARRRSPILRAPFRHFA